MTDVTQASEELRLRGEWVELDAAAEDALQGDEEQAYAIGKRDGFARAIQLLDMLTGGDGEYRFCTVPDERHCPTPVEMGLRVAHRAAHRQAAWNEAVEAAAAAYEAEAESWVAWEKRGSAQRLGAAAIRALRKDV